MTDDPLHAWLLDSDPALRWQVERDVLDEPADAWQATRARIAIEGMGAQLLALQDPDGQWAGGAYFPADDGAHAVDPAEPGQPWTATTWTLTTLRDWGLDADVLRARRTAELLGEHCRWEYDDLPYWGGEVDCCINAMTLANGAWLGADVAGIVGWFAEHQLPDGGWNCEWVEGSTRSSVHSTLNALKGLLDYDMRTGGEPVTRDLRASGERYLLERNLMRRLSTGEVMPRWIEPAVYPFRWTLGPLHAAEYFRVAAGFDGAAPDPRMAEAIELIRGARQPDGTWLQGARHPGRVWFELDVPQGEPSKWLTLHALRVLAWWDGSPDGEPQAAG